MFTSSESTKSYLSKIILNRSLVHTLRVSAALALLSLLGLLTGTPSASSAASPSLPQDMQLAIEALSANEENNKSRAIELFKNQNYSAGVKQLLLSASRTTTVAGCEEINGLWMAAEMEVEWTVMIDIVLLVEKTINNDESDCKSNTNNNNNGGLSLLAGNSLLASKWQQLVECVKKYKEISAIPPIIQDKISTIVMATALGNFDED